MGNGALPHGPSYRAHPRLYHSGHRPERLHLLLAGFKRGWLLFEVVFELTVNWHHCTPDRERRRVKMYKWTHKHRLQRYWSSLLRGYAARGCPGTHARAVSMILSSIRSN
jgi:hypothetical protein